MKKCIYLLSIFIIAANSIFAENIRSPIKNSSSKFSSDSQSLEVLINQIQREQEAYYKLLKEWGKEKTKIAGEINFLKREKELLDKSINDNQKELSSLKAQVEKIKKELEEKGKSQISYSPYLWNCVKKLEDTINKGLPFHIKERKRRVERLKGLLNEENETLEKKFKKLWEVLQIELNYGDSCEVYEGSIKVSKNKIKMVKMLRIGKIALFYRTLDGKEYGLLRGSYPDYEWIINLNSSSIKEIKSAIDIIEKMKPSSIVSIPLSITKEVEVKSR
ncbi:MAG: DUF3450 family protein [bacterium]|nr:DUF3450 family protein [bacterium]